MLAVSVPVYGYELRCPLMRTGPRVTDPFSRPFGRHAVLMSSRSSGYRENEEMLKSGRRGGRNFKNCHFSSNFVPPPQFKNNARKHSYL